MSSLLRWSTGILFVSLMMVVTSVLACSAEEGSDRPDPAATSPTDRSTGPDGSTQTSFVGTSQESGQRGGATAGSTPSPNPLPSFPAEAIDGDYDYDDDGLIEVRTLAQLDAMRLDPESTALIREGRDEYFAAFPGTGGQSGCPNQICVGYELAAHLDFDTNGNGQADAGDDYWNSGNGWEPLTLSKGTIFDGNGYTIANLYINGKGAARDEIGFFAYNIGEITNVRLESVDIQGLGNSASLVYSNGGIVSGCTVRGNVTSSQGGAGGLTVTNEGTISRSVFDGNVLARYGAGGLALENVAEATITHSMANGNVSALLKSQSSAFSSGKEVYSLDRKNTFIGGLVAINNGNINDSFASSEVSGRNVTGGLVGYNLGAITVSRASGNVSGNGDVGGLVGLNGYQTSVGGASFRSTIYGSEARGNVSGRVSVGGLVGRGRAKHSVIDNSEARGRVTGSRYVGGLIGFNRGDVLDSAAFGNVFGGEHVGGLAGYNGARNKYAPSSIVSSKANGHVIGISNVGGLVGYNRGTIADSISSGDVAGNAYRGGLVGVNDEGNIENCKEFGTVSLNEAPAFQEDKDVLALLGLSTGDVLFDEMGGAIAVQSRQSITMSREIGRLESLEYLNLRAASGQIPPELGDLANLESLHLSGDGLTGNIPPELGDLVNLKSLHLSGDGLTGNIPPELGELVNLESLRLSGGGLTGDIPTELGNLTNLLILGVWGPTGCIPNSLQAVNIRLDDLPFCTGPINTPEAVDEVSDESVSSASTSEDTATRAPLTAGAAALAPLTAAFLHLPSFHDGQNEFTFELRFSEEFQLSYVTLRNHAFMVNGGDVTQARRLEKPGNIRWEISVRPDGNRSVTVVLPSTTDCTAEGAICTEDGRKLFNRLDLTVSGPGG